VLLKFAVLQSLEREKKNISRGIHCRPFGNKGAHKSLVHQAPRPAKAGLAIGSPITLTKMRMVAGTTLFFSSETTRNMSHSRGEERKIQSEKRQELCVEIVGFYTHNCIVSYVLCSQMIDCPGHHGCNESA